MTEIKIMRLVIENFKCHRHLELIFEGRNATIYGDNAAGKTSVYDALTWLLFGKDSAGNGEKNIDIKPLDATGAVADHDAITSVEAALLVAGEMITLKRTYREVWTTKRGGSKETYDGNTSEYFVNSVPCKKNVFDAKISELVPEETFRLLTSVSYFAQGLHWQKRRAVLFDIVGTLSDREIMATDSRFEVLSQAIGNLPLEDYRRKLTAERKGFVGIKDETPARLNECQKTIQDLEGLDFAAAKAEVAALEEQQRQISAQMLALDHNSAADSKRMEIRECNLALEKLNMENSAFRTQQTVGTADPEALQRQIIAEQNRLAMARTRMEADRRSLSSFDKAVDDLRNQWITVNGEAFTGGTCPTCGQSLPFDQLRTATESFEARKQQRLNEITQNANIQKQAKTAAEVRIREYQTEISDRELTVAGLEQEYQLALVAKVTPVDMDGYAETYSSIQSSIRQLEADLQVITDNASDERNQLRAGLSDLNCKLACARDVVAKEGVLQYARQRIEAIRVDASNAAAALEAIEKMLFSIEEYTRHKARFVENSINSLFRVARFRLFREQANGGLEERCDVVCGGVPYMGLNNGAKINVGIDIINTLSRHFGVSVPLFVDNAESVTRLEGADTQVIRLVVSENDKELRVV